MLGKLIFGLLAVSFVSASLFAHRFDNVLVRAFYKVSAVWLGMLSFLLAGAFASWTFFAAGLLARRHPDFRFLAEICLGVAAAVGAYGVVNSNWMRITRETVQLENLPETWQGRKAALISDLHLGHVRNGAFLRRTVAKIMREEPDVIFIAGDLYDGTAIDEYAAAEPLRELAAPHGVYFVAGNHDQFGGDEKYVDAVSAAGVRVLHNEKVEVDGLQILGVPYGHASNPKRFAATLEALGPDRKRASILLTHAPDFPQLAETAGVSLQLSGHTHRGQFIPWSWMARRVYRQFLYGLSRIGQMQVFTSSGAGTWGPPLRVGSNPEFVMLEFQ
jgi:predicted MPP superfamily phosphohydrolase